MLLGPLLVGCHPWALLEDPQTPGRMSLDETELSFLERGHRRVRAAMGYFPDEAIANQHFRKGEALFQQKRYYQAAAQFQEAALRWPDSSLEEDAMFKAAESYFFADDYTEAAEWYEKLVERHENTKHLEIVTSRQFLIARYWEEVARRDPSLVPNLVDKKIPTIDTLGEARRIYGKIRLSDPTGPLADDSLMAHATSYFDQSRFTDADYYYDTLRKEYPRSEHQTKARLLAIQSKVNSYQGAYYDPSRLEEAEKLSKNTLVQLSSELSEEERSDLIAKQNAIYRAKAEREFKMGEFYRRQGSYRAARFYYRSVLEQFPDWEYTPLARQHLAELQGKPDEPEPLRWLAAPFQYLEEE